MQGLWGGRRPSEDLKEGCGAGVPSRSERRRGALSALDTLSACPESPGELTRQPQGELPQWLQSRQDVQMIVNQRAVQSWM